MSNTEVQIKIPPDKRCSKCYYWMQAYSGNPNYRFCHFCYLTGKMRKRGENKCYSFLSKAGAKNESKSKG